MYYRSQLWSSNGGCGDEGSSNAPRILDSTCLITIGSLHHGFLESKPYQCGPNKIARAPATIVASNTPQDALFKDGPTPLSTVAPLCQAPITRVFLSPNLNVSLYNRHGVSNPPRCLLTPSPRDIGVPPDALLQISAHW